MKFYCQTHPDKTLDWTEKDFYTKGNPVCPICDSEMIPTIEKDKMLHNIEYVGQRLKLLKIIENFIHSNLRMTVDDYNSLVELSKES